MSDLHDTDILAWSERQAALLRRVATGQLVNEDEIDWANIIDEVESVGNEQRFKVESLLLQILLHTLKVQAWPLSVSVAHWQSEIRVFQAEASNRYAPSMRTRIDVAKIYAKAVRALPAAIDGRKPLPVPQDCPFTLEDLLGDDP
jgi:hypothetical protein